MPELAYFYHVKHVGILSDTHGFIHPGIPEFFRDVNEIWHAGDIGDVETAGKLRGLHLLRAVHGNIDNLDIRSLFPEYQLFTVELARVLLIHIGGSPGRYNPKVLSLISQHRPDLFICGHSHILKVRYDRKNKLLFINPGAAGKSGAQHSITAVRIVVEGKEFSDLEVLDVPLSS